MTDIHGDNDNQSPKAHDDSDSTIIYDYQPDVNDIEIKIISICAMETETKTEEIKSMFNSTKNTKETETYPEEQTYPKENQTMIHSINNKKESTIEPQMDSSNNQNMKTVKIIFKKLSTQEINEPPKTKKC